MSCPLAFVTTTSTSTYSTPLLKTGCGGAAPCGESVAGTETAKSVRNATNAMERATFVQPPKFFFVVSWFRGSLEVVPDPHCETCLPECIAAALLREHDVFPGLIEGRAPRPVEVDGEAEREGLEPEAVRRTPVLQAEAVDHRRRAVDRNRIAVRIADDVAERIHLIPGDRLAGLGGVRRELIAAAGRAVVRRD